MPRTAVFLAIAVALAGAWWLLSDGDTPPVDLDPGEDPAGAREAGGPGLTARGARPREDDRAAPGAGKRTSRKPAQASPPVAPTVVRYRGRVLDSEGRPVAGATVVLRGSGLEPVRVQADGTFEIEVPAGRYDLLVRTDDGGVLYQENLSIGGDVPEVVALAVQEGPALVVVVLRAGVPAPGVDVALTATSARSLGNPERAILRAQTLRGGRVVLGSPPQGTYSLLLTFADGLTMRRAHEHADDAVVQLDTGPSVLVRGRVTEGLDGRGIADAAVRLAGQRTGQRLVERTAFTAAATSGLEGRFEISVPKAAYTEIRVAAKGYSPWPPSGGAVSDRRSRDPIFRALYDVGRGKPADVRIPLVAAGDVAVRGVVRDMGQHPVGGIDVGIVLGSGNVANPDVVVATGPDGRFETGALRPGVYRAFVATDAWTTRRMAAFTIEEGAQEPVEIVLEVRAAGSLRGRVVRQDGTPVAGARVWLATVSAQERQPDEPGMAEVFTDREGRWRIPGVGPGAARVLHAAWGAMRAQPVRAPPAGAKTETTLTLAPAVTLRVLVVERGSTQPVPGARVKVEPVPRFGRSMFLMFCDDEGRFEVEQMLPLGWRLKPWSQWHLEHDWKDVDLTGKKGLVEVTLELDPGLAIGGRVHDDRGEPLVATIVVTGADGDGRSVYRRLESDEDGLFRATGFRQGTYALRAEADGHARAVRTGLKGGEEHLDLKLSPSK